MAAALQVAEHHIEDVNHVVAGAGGEQVGVGQQRRDAPSTTQVGELGGPGLIGVAGQRGHPRGRQPEQIALADAERTHLSQPFQGSDQPGDRRGERRAAQPVKLGAPRALGDQQQLLQPRHEFGWGRRGESSVQPTRGPVAHRGDQPRQHAVPGQQNLLGQQMAMRGAEQYRRAHIVGPGLPIQPHAEHEMPGLGGEVPIPVAVRVKADETVAHFDLMNASGVGLLIQAVVGSFGGAGFWCRNRAGLAV